MITEFDSRKWINQNQYKRWKNGNLNKSKQIKYSKKIETVEERKR